MFKALIYIGVEVKVYEDSIGSSLGTTRVVHEVLKAFFDVLKTNIHTHHTTNK
jgi:hypothetical protein